VEADPIEGLIEGLENEAEADTDASAIDTDTDSVSLCSRSFLYDVWVWGGFNRYFSIGVGLIGILV
jgi:hypothetical protein